MSLKYESTRSRNTQESPSNAIINGLASDGGLFVYRYIDDIKIDYSSLLYKSYQEMAFVILKALLFDFDDQILKQSIEKAYSSNFNNPDITPIKKVGNDFILELFHGPTLAFKDIALSLLPHLMQASLKINNNTQRTLILTATSGDTGKAALEGFKDIPNTEIIVFYPLDKVSKIQEKQMLSASGSNVFVCGIKGNFDDAQRAVKNAMSNKALNSLCIEKNIHLSSANSINIGRLIPQIVYYFYAYTKLVEQKEITQNDLVNFSVPTGNFGNILAGYLAKKMGLPIKNLLCASNRNNVLFEFLRSGIYNRNSELHKTISPSMDILLSSNLERLLYYKTSENNEYVNSLMKNLNVEGKYTIDEYVLKRFRKDFYASFASDIQTKETIKLVYQKYNYILDPHSAIGYKAMLDYQLDTNDPCKCIVLATASPYKFATTVYHAITNEYFEDEMLAIKALEKLMPSPIPCKLKAELASENLHDCQIDQNEILAYIKEHIHDNN